MRPGPVRTRAPGHSPTRVLPRVTGGRAGRTRPSGMSPPTAARDSPGRRTPPAPPDRASPSDRPGRTGRRSAAPRRGPGAPAHGPSSFVTGSKAVCRSDDSSRPRPSRPGSRYASPGSRRGSVRGCGGGDLGAGDAFRAQRLAPLLRDLAIDGVAVDDDPVGVERRLPGDGAFLHVVEHACRVALERIAEAAAPGARHHEGLGVVPRVEK